MASVTGTRGNDNLKGTSGNDTFFGGGGSDQMFGDGGNDTFFANNGGNDTFNGGTGSDTVNYSKITQASSSFWGFDGVVVDLFAGGGTEINLSSGQDQFSSIENVTGSNFNDYILGDSNANIIRGLAGNDRIEGRAGADTLDGGDGIDMLDYYHSTSRVVVDLQSNSANEGDAKGDIISNFENLRGSAYNDILSGSAVSNTIYGLEGNDSINGRAGDDKIDGGAGNDTLIGGSGNDTLIGGSQSDTFVFRVSDANAGIDHITDFSLTDHDVIRIDVSDITHPDIQAQYDSGAHALMIHYHPTDGSAGWIVVDNVEEANVLAVAQSIQIV